MHGRTNKYYIHVITKSCVMSRPPNFLRISDSCSWWVMIPGKTKKRCAWMPERFVTIFLVPADFWQIIKETWRLDSSRIHWCNMALWGALALLSMMVPVVVSKHIDHNAFIITCLCNTLNAWQSLCLIGCLCETRRTLVLPFLTELIDCIDYVCVYVW